MLKRSTVTCECLPGRRPALGCSRSASHCATATWAACSSPRTAHPAPPGSSAVSQARTDVYVGVCLRNRRAGGRDAIDRSHLAFVEIDTSDALDRLHAFPHSPSMIICSGTAGHAHAYFTLSAPVRCPSSSGPIDASRTLSAATSPQSTPPAYCARRPRGITSTRHPPPSS